MRTVYLDYNATTPLDSGVRDAMRPLLDGVFGNPSSVHHIGRAARTLLDDSRERVAGAWRCKPGEVVFTSGGTESNNLAILGAARHLRPKGRHLITTPVEHHAVLQCFEYLAKKEGYSLDLLPVDEDGLVDPSDLKSMLQDDTLLVSIMAVNNETGTILPVSSLGAICREHGVLFHTDAVQWAGKEPMVDIHQFNADLVSVCGHKIYGPKGSGALFVRSPLQLDPVLFGGEHENERRAGTENLAGIVGLTKCLEQFTIQPVFNRDHLGPLSRRLDNLASCIESLHSVGSSISRLANTASFTVDGADSITLLAALDMEGICASSGSACSSGSVNPSHVLLAMGKSQMEANSLVRFSLGRESKEDDISHVEAVLPSIIDRIRNVN